MEVKEIIFNAVCATVATCVSALLGGWDAAIGLLVTLMIADYITGFLGAVRGRRVNSEVMFWGGIRKGIILAVIALAVQLDGMLGNAEPILRTLAIYFYAAREGISVTENLGILGVDLPPVIVKVLEQLQAKGDATK